MYFQLWKKERSQEISIAKRRRSCHAAGHASPWTDCFLLQSSRTNVAKREFLQECKKGDELAKKLRYARSPVIFCRSSVSTVLFWCKNNTTSKLTRTICCWKLQWPASGVTDGSAMAAAAARPTDGVVADPRRTGAAPCAAGCAGGVGRMSRHPRAPNTISPLISAAEKSAGVVALDTVAVSSVQLRGALGDQHRRARGMDCDSGLRWKAHERGTGSARMAWYRPALGMKPNPSSPRRASTDGIDKLQRDVLAVLLVNYTELSLNRCMNVCQEKKNLNIWNEGWNLPKNCAMG